MVLICERNILLLLLLLSFQQFYCLPDNYEVIDSSLDDIKVGQITIFKMILSQVDQANVLWVLNFKSIQKNLLLSFCKFHQSGLGQQGKLLLHR